MIKVFYILAVVPFIVTIDSFSIQPKIVNGIVSNTDDFSFFVYIHHGDKQCSGTLISDRYVDSLICWKILIRSNWTTEKLNFRWVLTAAHCLRHNTTLTINFGIDQSGGFFDEIQVSTVNQYMHPSYSRDSMQPFDIGLYFYTIRRSIKYINGLSQLFDRFDRIAEKYKAKFTYSTHPATNTMREWFGKYRCYSYRQWKNETFASTWRYVIATCLSNNHVIWGLWVTYKILPKAKYGDMCGT